MQKHIYFIRSAENQHGDLKRKVLEHVVTPLKAQAYTHIKLNISLAPPSLSLVPFSKNAMIMISLWSEEGLTPEASTLEAMKTLGQVWSYAVDESAPVQYQRDWPNESDSPGVVLLTLLKKNPNISYDDFMHEWHGRHTPKAMRIHPMWNYIRNVTLERLQPDSPAFEGFVEEHYRQLSDVTNPIKMFGGGFFTWIKNIIEVGLHVKTFLDLPNLENYLMSEYHIR